MQGNSSEHKDLHGLIEEIKADLSGYLQLKFKYFKLKTFEKSSLLVSFVGYGLVLVLIVLTIILLLLIALGLLLGEVLESYSAGFAILTLVALIVLVIYILCAKSMRRFIANKTLSIIRKIIEDEED